MCTKEKAEQQLGALYDKAVAEVGEANAETDSAIPAQSMTSLIMSIRSWMVR